MENPDSVDEENGLLVRYLNDRLTALSSNYPGKNLVEDLTAVLLPDRYAQVCLPV